MLALTAADTFEMQLWINPLRTDDNGLLKSAFPLFLLERDLVLNERTNAGTHTFRDITENSAVCFVFSFHCWSPGQI